MDNENKIYHDTDPSGYGDSRTPDIKPAASYKEYQEQLDRYKDMDARNNMAADITLNPAEKALDECMDSLRENMINDKYVCAIGDTVAKPRYYPPIHPFYEAKAKLLEDERTPEYKLFDIFRKMPKGGNLHIHTSATLSVDKLMDLLKDFDNKPMSEENSHKWAVYVLREDRPEKNAVKNTLYLVDNRDKQISPPDYYIKYSDLKPDEIADLKSDLCFLDDEKMKQTDYIWDAFSRTFSRVYTILDVKPFYYEFYVRSFEELIDDNIDYVEVRCGISHLVDNNNDKVMSKQQTENVSSDTDEYPFQTIYDAYQTVKQKHPDFLVKLIISGSRKKDSDVVSREVQKVREWMQNPPKGIEPNFILGYDLVGEEDRGRESNFYAEALYASGCVGKVPFYFHDGESCWANDDNIYSAFTLGSRRIGHGLNLFRFPAMVEQMRKNNITLEVCPVSNQLLRYTADLRMHPIGEYINRGIPCTICSDDPLILGNPGLAYDFWAIYLGALLSLKEVKKLILNSYQYSGMTEDEKKLKIDAWNRKWDAFVSEINEFF